MNFILEIQKNLEEKRLDLGKKLEDFLLKTLFTFFNSFKEFFITKFGLTFFCTTIIAISILAKSTRDIGNESILILETIKVFFADTENHKNLLKNISPALLPLASIPHFLTKFFQNFFYLPYNTGAIIFLEIISNLTGIVSLIFSIRILNRSKMSEDKILFHAIVISFCCAFFLRVFSLQLNEFGTSSNYLLAIIFPYISYHFLDESKLSKTDQIIIGTLAAVITCLNFYYLILILALEIKKKKNLSRLLALILITFYILLFPDCLKPFNPTIQHVFSSFKQDLFPIFFLIIFCCFKIGFSTTIRPLLLLALMSGLISIFTANLNFYEQRAEFYSLSIPIVFVLITTIIRHNLINFKRDWIWLLFILIIPQFDSQFFEIARDICVIWWVFVFVLSKEFRETGSPHIFLPKNKISWISFLAIALTTTTLSITITHEISWLISLTVLIASLVFYQKLHTNLPDKQEFSRTSACAIFIVISYIISLHLATIFNFKNSDTASHKSPNYANDQVALTIKESTKDGEEVLMIGKEKSLTYPMFFYLGKEDKFFSTSSDQRRLTLELSNPKNRLIFVENNKNTADEKCETGPLERYFQNAEFKHFFLKNYIFLNRIIETKMTAKEISFFSGDELENEEYIGLKNAREISKKKNEKVTREIEVYIKNSKI